MLNPYPKVYLLSVAEAGDAKLLQDSGIEVLCWVSVPRPPFTHFPAQVSLWWDEEGATPDWVVGAFSSLWSAVFGQRSLALVDRHDGTGPAAALLVAARATRMKAPFADVLVDLESKLPASEDGRRHHIAPAVADQGKRVWK